MFVRPTTKNISGTSTPSNKHQRMNQTKPMNKIQQIENEIQDLMVEAHEIIGATRPDVSGVGYSTNTGGYFSAWSAVRNATGSSFSDCLTRLPEPLTERQHRIEKLRAELAYLEGEEQK